MTISSALTIGFVQHFAFFLREHVNSSAVDNVVDIVGLPHPLKVSADVKISLYQEARFIEEATRAARDLDFAIKGGLTLSVGTSLPSYVSEHSRTLRDAIIDAARFVPLVRPGLDLKLEEREEVAALSCSFGNPRLERYPRHCEAIFAGIVGQIRAFTARPFRPKSLSFRHHRAPIDKSARSGLGCKVLFGSNSTELTFAHAALKRPIRGRDDALRAILVEHGELLLRNADRHGLGFAERVELVIQHSLPNQLLDAEAVSAKLGMSRRTMARKLSDSGTTFSEIVAQVRSRIAARELRESERSIGEIAWRLGYRSQASFSTAFRKVTGLSPSAYRKSAEGGGSIVQFQGSI